MTIRSRISTPIRKQFAQQSRWYSEIPKTNVLRSDDLLTSETEEDAINQEARDETTLTSANEIDYPTIPWYLQEEEPQLIPSMMLERQKLPDLPDDPPQCLQPMLEYLSQNIGLDYLTLTDLRKLDPPPALGAGLIMIFGTARSEKHLHVSADRFARWLRSNYKLTPRADGLLGRNEIKLKLRRRAKRARLLRTVGSEPSPDRDDGLSSGWVCVNAGIVEQGSHQERSLDEEGIIGFGGRDDGIRLVVQMLTEEKRAQLDLETLWNNAISRQERKESREIANSNAELIEEATSTESFLYQRPRTFAANHVHRQSFHSYARVSNSAPISGDTTDIDSIDAGSQIPSSSETKEVYMSSPRAEELLSQLQASPPEECRALLGQDARDRGSHQFLSDFHSSLPPPSETSHWAYRLELLEEGLYNSHPGYMEGDVIELFNEMQDSFIITPSPFFESVIDILVKPAMHSKVPDGTRFLNNFSLILGVLDSMQVRAITPSQSVSENILTAAILAKTFDKSSVLRPDTIHGVMQALATSQVHLTSPYAQRRILGLLARVGNWEEYWQFYRGIALQIQRRPQMLYAAIFQHLAATNNRQICSEALLDLMADTQIESPPVELAGSLARSVMECLMVVEPQIQTLLQAEKLGRQEQVWVALWLSCEASLNEPDEELEPEGGFVVQTAAEAQAAAMKNADRYRKVLIRLRDP